MDTYYDEYAAWTDTTAKYPVEAEGAYLGLGIGDEFGELTFAVSRASETAVILKEAGDCCWYLARYCRRVLRTSFADAIAAGRGEPLIGWSDVIELVGTIAGVEKKRIRDGATWEQSKLDEKNSLALDAVIKLLAFVRDIARSEDSDLLEVLEMNQGKLNTRLKDGKIQGDGDNR